MLDLAEIFRLHGESFRATHPLSSWQLKAMADIEHCRTAYFGGHLEQCDRCGYQHYSYHSCANRHCPKCHGQQTQRWLARQQERLLPSAYYLITVTLPQELRPLARAHPREIYTLFLSIVAAAVQILAADPQWLGAKPALLAVLHTWTRALLYHPHVHLLVSAGGLSEQGHWVTPNNPAYLMPDYALRKIVRAKFQAALRGRNWLQGVSSECWQKKWVIHCRHAGSGHKVLDYLGRYVFRIALCNSRLEKLENGQVTFHYRERKTQQLKSCTLSADQFMERFLQHVLPKGFVKVRSYGLWSARNHDQLQRVKECWPLPPPPQDIPSKPLRPAADQPNDLCPQCKQGHLIFIERLASIRPQRKWPP
jgi:Putative transposase/Transposase zinc-binding domain